MKKICDDSKCTGCLACMNTCSKEAITIQYNEKGLMLPSIDQDKCVNCGLCAKICPVNNPIELKKPMKAYAAWNLDDNKHKLSSSGGIARAMYDYAIDNGGVCYGTRFDNNLDLRIVKADSKKELDEFQGSKYVQAIVGDSLKQTRADLKSGKLVVYVGTPCQIAGLRNYLHKDYENLITADLICHGVPSIKYLHDHIDYLEKKIAKKATNVKFRGLYDFKFSLFDADEVIYSKDNRWDAYFTGFLDGLFYRPNCYECRYATSERVSDITIGDFWGIGSEKPFKNPEIKGVSAVLPNTEKGDKFLEKLKDRVHFEERSVSEAVSGNTQLRQPSKKHRDYDKFLESYQKLGFEKAAVSILKEDMKRNQKMKRKDDIKRIRGDLKWKIINASKKIVGK